MYAVLNRGKVCLKYVHTHMQLTIQGKCIVYTCTRMHVLCVCVCCSVLPCVAVCCTRALAHIQLIILEKR